MENQPEFLKTYDPELAHTLAKNILPKLEKYFRAEYKGFDNIPNRNFLGVGNHGGAYYTPETFLWSGKYIMEKTPEQPNMLGLTHSFAVDIQEKIKSPFVRTGMIRGEYKNAIEALGHGYSIMVYPGGDRETCKPFKERYTIDFYGHKGYLTLAIEAGVPILPVVSIGGHEAVLSWYDGAEVAELLGWKKKFRLNVLPFTLPALPLPAQITVSVLPPFTKTLDVKKEDARNPEVLAKLNEELLGLMQTEMDHLAEDRLPWVGKVLGR